VFPSDVRLWICGENGELVWTDMDEAEPITLDGFELAAGTYIFEVGTSGDADNGEYILKVSTIVEEK
jgi:hypothetical protein